jgi:small subunit ribosomal protein S8
MKGGSMGMHVTDPVADMLTRIRNANTVYHEMVDMPMSRLRLEIARILKDEGYIRNYKTVTDPKFPSQTLRVYMSYGAGRERVIQGLRRISKPGRRIYVHKEDVPRVMGGLGIALISTSNGLMTDAEARKRGLGGEVMCYVW